MDNRFNVKDIVLIVLILGLGVLTFFDMWLQDRRGWDAVQQSVAQLDEHDKSLRRYERELQTYKREQEALRKGVQQMNASVGELVEVLRDNAGDGGGPKLGEGDADIGPITFTDKSFENDPTFERVAEIRKRDDYAEGDYFIDAFATTVKSLTPYIAGDIYASRIAEYVLESLLTIDPVTLEFKPWIAESWAVSDDGMTITYNLRDDVVFADGHPMDSSDVVFTYEWLMNPKVDAPRMRSTYLEKLEYVKALDKYTVQFKYREPYFQALTVTGLYLQILPEHWVKQFSVEEYNKEPGLLFGSGPYKLAIAPTEWEPGSGKIEVVRNDNYWGPRPALDRVIWREILDDNARLVAFRNREIDRLGILAEWYRDLSNDESLREQKDLFEFEYVSRGYSYIGWNQDKDGRPTPFADKRVRQAMTLLIDRQAMASRIYDNLVSPATGPFSPLGWQVDPSIEPWPYDPERAKKLLAEAGYIDRDGDGQIESEEGEPFEFEFIYSANSTSNTRLAEMMRDSMKQAGIKMTLNALDWPAMQQKLGDRTFDAIILGWGGAVDTDLYQMFHSSQIDDGGNNYYAHRSEKLDAVIEQARGTVARDKGQPLWREAHAILHEEQPYTFMFNPKTVIMVDKRVQNVMPTKLGLNNAWEYYVPAPLQLHTGN